MDLIFPTSSPFDMPETSRGIQPFKTGTFKLLYNQTKAPTRGSKQQVAGLGPDVWQIRMATDQLVWPDANAIQTWLEMAEGGKFPIKAWHPQLRYPQKYRTGFSGLVRAGGSDAFDGTCNITAVGDTLRSLAISALPVGFQISFGDMISYPFEDGQMLHRITGAVTSDALGKATIAVVPTLPISLEVNDPPDVATFFKPWCYATVDADSIDAPLDGNTGVVTFTATQS